MSLCRLELLRCDRNQLSLLRVGGHTLKSLHAAHNRTDALMFITVLLVTAQPEGHCCCLPSRAGTRGCAARPRLYDGSGLVLVRWRRSGSYRADNLLLVLTAFLL